MDNDQAGYIATGKIATKLRPYYSIISPIFSSKDIGEITNIKEILRYG